MICSSEDCPNTVLTFKNNLHVIPETNLTRALHTIFRDKNCSTHDFVTTTDRLVRLLIEYSLGLLPTTPVIVDTPVPGATYDGVSLPEDKICAVSILRAADCMVSELRRIIPSCPIAICVTAGVGMFGSTRGSRLLTLLYGDTSSVPTTEADFGSYQ